MSKKENGNAKSQSSAGGDGKALGIIGLGAVLLILVFAATLLYNPQQGISAATSMEKFQSYDDLVSYFEKAQLASSYGGMRGGIVVPMMAGAVANAGAEKAVSDQSIAVPTATDFSKTNVQVEGVDEADIVKNDGKYVYAIAQGELFIINAYPAENMKIISKLDLNGSNPVEMFISANSDKLLVFTNDSGGGYYGGYSGKMMAGGIVASMPVRPWYYGSGFVSAKLFDISDKTNPVLEKSVDIEGTYLNSRLIGDNAYFVVNSYPRIYYAQPMTGIAYDDSNSIIPVMRVNGTESRIAKPTEIGILPGVRPDSFLTIASINLETLELNKQTTTASAQNIYASASNLYLADQYWEYNVDKNLPTEIVAIGALARSIYYPNWSATEKTVVNKFSLDSGKIDYAGQAAVPGHILNQFSMDEYNDNFRIATTVETGYGEIGMNSNGVNAQRSSNNIYVMDKDMKVIGTLEGLAPNEQIYSVRFTGDKGYVVTFKYVDPLFVLDLSNPSDPKVLGKLKIPGYSDYMQPIDSTHLLGIGRDVNELEDAEKVHSVGAVYYTAIKGIKMAIFDVSDVANPKEMYKATIGGRGTDSEALNEHRAILFDKAKQLLVLPITIVNEEASTVGTTGVEQSFQGAVVYNVSLENGFSEKGKITHVSAQDELKSGYYYGNNSMIRRSLFMDNTLYTLSANMLKANNLDSLAEINSVLFPAIQSLDNTQTVVN